MPSSENFDPKRIKSAEKQLFGIRITLEQGDTFAQLLGDSWETTRWYANEAERNNVLGTIGERHAYSRIGDKPTLRYEAIESSRQKI